MADPLPVPLPAPAPVPFISANDWKTKIGVVLSAVAAAFLAVDFEKDTPKTIAIKLALAAAAALVGIGAADKSQKNTAAIREQTQVIAATNGVSLVAAPKELTPAQKAAAYDAIQAAAGK